MATLEQGLWPWHLLAVAMIDLCQEAFPLKEQGVITETHQLMLMCVLLEMMGKKVFRRQMFECCMSVRGNLGITDCHCVSSFHLCSADYRCGALSCVFLFIKWKSVPCWSVRKASKQIVCIDLTVKCNWPRSVLWYCIDGSTSWKIWMAIGKTPVFIVLEILNHLLFSLKRRVLKQRYVSGGGLHNFSPEIFLWLPFSDYVDVPVAPSAGWLGMGHLIVPLHQSTSLVLPHS